MEKNGPSVHTTASNSREKIKAMWKVSKVPMNYTPSNKEEWCVIDDDNDLHDFYSTEEAAYEGLNLLLKSKGDLNPKEVTVLVVCSLRLGP